MQKLYFSPTSTTPEICFSPDERIFFMRGVSSPEDVREMYYPVIEWFHNYTELLIEEKSNHYSKNLPLKFQVDLEYFNSSSAKFLYDIFMQLKRLHSFRIPVVVEWIYDEEDSDLQEAGSDISSLVKMDFTYVSKPH
jgi:SiaC family regulatory phosphoprotein